MLHERRNLAQQGDLGYDEHNENENECEARDQRKERQLFVLSEDGKGSFYKIDALRKSPDCAQRSVSRVYRLEKQGSCVALSVRFTLDTLEYNRSGSYYCVRGAIKETFVVLR